MRAPDDPTQDGAVPVLAFPGKLPVTSDRAVVFFANLGSLFFGNRMAAAALQQMLSGTLNSYGGRLAPVLDLLFRDKNHKGNLLVVDRLPDPDLLAYQGGILGLEIPEIVAAGDGGYESEEMIETVRSHPAGWLDGFVTDVTLAHIAEKSGKRCFSTPEGSVLANNKMALHEELLALGMPVFDTEIAANPDCIPRCCARLAALGYRSAAVKAQIGASGIGIVKIATRIPEPLPELLFHDGACLVQGWIEQGIKGVRYVHSPSVQVYVGADAVYLYDITDQILDHQSVHEGNIAPPLCSGRLSPEGEELLRQAAPIAQWLHEIDYRGPASVDFHVATRDGAVETRACEVNARVTGATYPSLLARRFEAEGAWLMRNLALPRPMPAGSLLQLLEDAGVLYRPGAKRGCFPVNFNSHGDGSVVKGQFLFLAPSVGEVVQSLTDLVALPQIDLHYDRD